MTIQNSNIEWTGPTWNPWQGCLKKTIKIDGQLLLREECRYCYMYREKKQYGQKPQIVIRSKKPTFEKPLKLQNEFTKGKRPNPIDRLIFTCSWSDWFNPEADAWRDEAWDIIRRCPDLTFQILTKLINRAADHLPPYWDEIKGRVWMGTSAGYQEPADWALSYLLEIDSAVRFLSAEPLLGLLDVAWALDKDNGYSYQLDWVIGGGESGPSTARPTHPAWAKGLKSQCIEARVPFFWKQWGEWFPVEAPRALYKGPHLLMSIDGTISTDMFNSQNPKGFQGFERPGRKKAGRLLDGQTWSQFPKGFRFY